MDDNWTQIRKMFLHLSDKSPSQRQDYLDMVCEGDDALRSDIEALLDEHDRLEATHTASGLFESTAPVSVIGDYHLHDVIGRGGLGTVYRAEHPRFGTVAFKLSSIVTVSESTAQARFEQEARALEGIAHPSLCHLHEAFVCEQGACLAMEFIDGLPLSDVLISGPMSCSQSISVIRQLLDGLSVAHEQGIVHRDIKPSNIMCPTSGGIKLIDFGIARFADSRLTRTGQIIGTPTYMAPEQWQGRTADVRTDLWAIGALWFELLAGRRAFAGDTRLQVAEAVLNDTRASLPPLSVDGESLSAVARIIDRCLQSQPDRRYARCEELHAATDALLDL